MIERADTGDRLGTRDRYSDAGIEFGARVPLMWTELRACRKAWLRHATREGWIRKAISLPGAEDRYDPADNFAAMPKIAFVETHLARGDFEIPTHEELGINAAPGR